MGGLPISIHVIYPSPDDLAQIETLGRTDAPDEACGLILPSPHGPGGLNAVIQLPNSAHLSNSVDDLIDFETLGYDPTDSTKAFAILATDVLSTLAAHPAAQPHPITGRLTLPPESIIVWHTHPNGSRGPSIGDLRTRAARPELRNLVVALLPDPDHTTGLTYDAQRY